MIDWLDSIWNRLGLPWWTFGPVVGLVVGLAVRWLG